MLRAPGESGAWDACLIACGGALRAESYPVDLNAFEWFYHHSRLGALAPSRVDPGAERHRVDGPRLAATVPEASRRAPRAGSCSGAARPAATAAEPAARGPAAAEPRRRGAGADVERRAGRAASGSR